MGRVRIILCQQIVQTVLRIGWKVFGKLDADGAKTRRTDGHQQCLNGLATFAQVIETCLDQFCPR